MNRRRDRNLIRFIDDLNHLGPSQISGRYSQLNSSVQAMRYPYPVHVTAPLFVTVRLKTKNFLMWESQITNLKESQGCMGFIDGIIRSPHMLITVSDSPGQLVSNPNFLAWKQTDRLIKGWIISTLSEEILSQVMGSDSAADVWFELKRKFISSTMDRELASHNQLQTIRRDSFDSRDIYLVNL